MHTAMVEEDNNQQEDVYTVRKRRPRAAFNAWAISVMVVEDDPADATLVVEVLRRHPNVASATAFETADTALFLLASGRYRPDLILLDIMMPKVNGFKFLQALDKIPTARETPVVMLTTSRSLRDVEQTKKSIACGYIVKPDSYDELRTRIDGAIKQAISGKWGF